MPFQAKKVEFRPDLAGGKRPMMMSWVPHNDLKKSRDDLDVVFNGFWNNFPKNKFKKTSISTFWITLNKSICKVESFRITSESKIELEIDFNLQCIISF